MDSLQKIEVELQTELARLRREVARLEVIEAKYHALTHQPAGQSAPANSDTENVAQNMISGLRTITHISTIIAGILDRGELLQTAVDLIQQHFDLYYVQIFLLDPGDDTLNMAAGTGPAGEALAAQGQTILFAHQQSLIASAAWRREAILANDVSDRSDFLADPLLPGTRAELAVPLSFGDTLLGVLDMQASQPHHFTQDDVRNSTILAGQLTVALQNSSQHRRMQIVLSNLTRRDQLLSALSKMGLDLMQHGPAVIQDSLARIGRSADVSRVYIFENFVDETDALCARQTYEWAAGGIEPQIDNPELQHVPYDTVVPRWREVLARGDKVVGLVRDFPDSERAILEPQDIRSILVLPMFVDNEFYGFMGFDDCRDERAWKALEVDVLQTASIFIVNTIVNQRLLEQARRQAERAQEVLSEQQTTAYLLGERVKELNCLNDVGRAVSESPATSELLHWTAERLPPAMRYPELCRVAIAYDGEIHGDPTALDLPARCVTPFRVMGEAAGHIYVAYAEAREFLDEEHMLLNGIANRLGGYIESQRLAEQTQTALAEVRQSQQFLRTIIDNIPTPVYYKDTQGIYLGFNRAFLKFVGKTEAELLGKTIYDLDIPKERADQLHETDVALLREPGVQVYEATVKHADGSTRDVIFNKATFTRADNSVGGLVGAMVDITARKTAEAEREKLLAEVRRLAAIVENHPDFIGVGTLDGKALYVNPAGLNMMGLPPDHDITQMNVNNFYPPADAETLIKVAIPTALEKGFWTGEANLRRTDRTLVPVEETVGINYDAGGEPHSFSITMRDISKRKATETERERLLAEVEAAYRQYVNQAWSGLLKEQQHGRWHAAVDQLHDVAQGEAADRCAKIETPIKLRGQQIGRLRLEDVDAARKWTGDELALIEAVSEQLAQTVENLRLFGETQQRATREQLTRQIADKMRTSPDIESIIQIGVQELSEVLGGSHVVVELDVPTGDE